MKLIWSLSITTKIHSIIGFFKYFLKIFKVWPDFEDNECNCKSKYINVVFFHPLKIIASMTKEHFFI